VNEEMMIALAKAGIKRPSFIQAAFIKVLLLFPQTADSLQTLAWPPVECLLLWLVMKVDLK
jgi:hypothetical protein